MVWEFYQIDNCCKKQLCLFSWIRSTISLFGTCTSKLSTMKTFKVSSCLSTLKNVVSRFYNSVWSHWAMNDSKEENRPKMEPDAKQRNEKTGFRLFICFASLHLWKRWPMKVSKIDLGKTVENGKQQFTPNCRNQKSN